MENPSIESVKQPNPIKSEHLLEGIKPIMACVGTNDQYDNELNIFKFRAQEIDYYSTKEFRQPGYLGSSKNGYVISNIDSDLKFTEHLYNCTSVIAVGIDKASGENISFLTHQDPNHVEFDSFKKDLFTRLSQLKNKSLDDSIDVVIVGGKLSPNNDTESYLRVMKILNKEISDVLGFEPVILTGPKESGSANKFDNAYFDTRERRLYIVRPKNMILHNDPFNASQIDDMNNRWKLKDPT